MIRVKSSSPIVKISRTSSPTSIHTELKLYQEVRFAENRTCGSRLLGSPYVYDERHVQGLKKLLCSKGKKYGTMSFRLEIRRWMIVALRNFLPCYV